MAKAIFFCGLACSGKSTLARFLEPRLPATRYSADELMRQRHDMTIFGEEFGIHLREVREQCWEQGRRDLDAGKDVLFDWNLWSKARRSEWCGRVAEAGHSPLILFLDIAQSELATRLEARNRDLPDSAHHIPLEEFYRFAQFLEPPSEEEGVAIIRVTSSDQPEAILHRLQASA